MLLWEHLMVMQHCFNNMASQNCTILLKELFCGFLVMGLMLSVCGNEIADCYAFMRSLNDDAALFK